MSNLSEKAIKFLSRKPSLIQTLQGYRFYEHPSLGEDYPMMCITPCGKLYNTCFMDLIDHEDLQYQINEWRETKKDFKA